MDGSDAIEKLQIPPGTPSAGATRPQREALKSAGHDRQRGTAHMGGLVEALSTAEDGIGEGVTPASAQVAKSPGGAGRPSSREAHRESLVHTRQMLEGKVPSPSVRRPTSRPASSRQIDSAEVFPLPPPSPSSSRSGLVVTSPSARSPPERPPSAGLGATSPTLAGDELVVSESSSPSSPEYAIKVFGLAEHEAPGGMGKPATPKRPTSERVDQAERTAKLSEEGGVAGVGVRQEYHGRVASDRKQQQQASALSASAQRPSRSVSRDSRPQAVSGPPKAARSSSHSRPTSTSAAWQPREEQSSVAMMSRVHRAQRVYMGTSGEGSGGKIELGANSTGLALGGRASGREGSSTSGSRRIVSAVPRTDIEVPALEREAISRRRQRQQEREHSAHPQSRVGGDGGQRTTGPIKPSRPERSGVRSASNASSGAAASRAEAHNAQASVGSRDSDGRAFFTGAAKSPANSNTPGVGERGGGEEGHPWSWIRDYPRLERPPSRQRHPTQSLHLSEPFPGGGGWLNSSSGGLDDGAGGPGPAGKKPPPGSTSSYGGRDSKPRPATQENRSPTGTSFGDNMELRPGTSVVAAADDDWAGASRWMAMSVSVPASVSEPVLCIPTHVLLCRCPCLCLLFRLCCATACQLPAYRLSGAVSLRSKCLCRCLCLCVRLCLGKWSGLEARERRSQRRGRCIMHLAQAPAPQPTSTTTRSSGRQQLFRRLGRQWHLFLCQQASISCCALLIMTNNPALLTLTAPSSLMTMVVVVVMVVMVKGLLITECFWRLIRQLESQR